MDAQLIYSFALLTLVASSAFVSGVCMIIQGISK